MMPNGVQIKKRLDRLRDKHDAVSFKHKVHVAKQPRIDYEKLSSLNDLQR